MSKDTGGPAFPSYDGAILGVTLRDYFAAKAMAAIILKLPSMTNSVNKEGEIVGVPDKYIESAMDAAAWGAYKYADAMLARRDK